MLFTIESTILLFIQEHIRCSFLSASFIPLSYLGEYGLLWIACSLIMLCFKKTRKAGVLGLISLLFCFLINNMVIKVLVNRTRPFTTIQGLTVLGVIPTDASFPSGHTNAAFACAVAYWQTLDIRILKIFLLVVACLMAFSRLYVGAHFPTDVLAGMVVGTTGSILVCTLLKNRKPFSTL